MNVWVCDEPTCDRTVVGVGGAIGLRAIGWYTKRGESPADDGPLMLCPEHRPDPIPGIQEGCAGQLCTWCAADREAAELQAQLGDPDFQRDLLEERRKRQIEAPWCSGGDIVEVYRFGQRRRRR